MVRAYFVGARAAQSVHRPVRRGSLIGAVRNVPRGPVPDPTGRMELRLMVLEKAAAAETNQRMVVRRRCFNERRHNAPLLQRMSLGPLLP